MHKLCLCKIALIIVVGVKMEKLRNLIAYTIKNFPRTISRTELVKLVYLFEYNVF